MSTLRLLLATVFLVSGASKAMDPTGTRRAIEAFGVSPRLARPGTWLLPAAELTVVGLLLFEATAWAGALVALVLLGVFAAGIAVNLSRGRRPECHCFGQLSAEPVSSATLWRNGVLALPALAILAAGPSDVGPSVFGWLGDDLSDAETGLAALVVVLGVALAVAAVALNRLATRQQELERSVELLERLYDERSLAPIGHGEALAPPEGLPIGALAPAFRLESATGVPVALEDLTAGGRAVVLLFVSPTCGPCRSLEPAIEAWIDTLSDRLAFALVSRGRPGDPTATPERLRGHLLWQGDTDLADTYSAPWTPGAVVVGPTGRIASAVAFGPEAITDLVAQAHEQAATAGAYLHVGAPPDHHHHDHDHHDHPGEDHPHPLGLGDQVPALRIERPEGAFTEADLRGRDTALLFWRATCPYCEEIQADLARWAESPPPGAPHLVLVIPHEEDPSSLSGATVLADPVGQLSAIFGTPGTPTAVVVDATGRTASVPAVGGEQVKALLGPPAPVTERPPAAVD